MIDQLDATVNLDFDAGGHLYATHALHAFAARCPPPLVRWAIERFSAPGDVILDPMCGSGTTLVEAALCGRIPWGADIDPLARMISKVKATPLDPLLVCDVADDLERRLRNDSFDTSWRPQLPGVTKWFRDDVAADLARLRSAISATVASPALIQLLWTIFSSLIIARTSVANARDLVHSRHHHRAWETAPDVTRRFISQIRRAARLMQDFQQRLRAVGNASPRARIVGSDARRLALGSASVGLIFTSPPYCSALDYTRAHSFSVAWMTDVLGISAEEYRILGRRYVGSERAPLIEACTERPLPPASGHATVDEIVTALCAHPKRAWIVHRYFRDMAAVLAESARILRPDGHAVLVVCPSNIRKVRIPTHEIFAAMASAATDGTLKLVELHQRTIHDHRRVMPYLEAAFGERMRTEYVLVLRKEPCRHDKQPSTVPLTTP